ncbi:hypothetical protein [Streptacidiphilus melanogenes]|uniref:hypothetical protein n=1 Tax=Streptacidiphilus melanogenes TaxID=411235 RepID=UPI0005A8BE19|nr:hypothetical protein [Streptacidiphilus melanogenes]
MQSSPTFLRNTGRTDGSVERWLHDLTGFVVAGIARLDRPWQEHARRNAFEAVAALRRDRRERLPFPAPQRTAPFSR